MKIAKPLRLFLAVIVAGLISMLDTRIRRSTKDPVWLRTDEGQEWLQNAKGREREGGWSLPLIPILLVAILTLMYFFGWKVLLIPLVVFLVIPLGTILYDKFSGRALEKTYFWFHSDQELSRLWELLVGTEHHSTDAEGDWEWWGAQVQEGESRYHLSISRKRDDSSHSVHITVIYRRNQFTPEMREDLGRRFAIALGVDVKAGSVEYLDEYGFPLEFTEEETFNSGGGARTAGSD